MTVNSATDISGLQSTAPDHPAAADLTVRSIRTQIVDIPTVREHKLSSLSVTHQSHILVRVGIGNGVEGIGEAATLGGPRWSEESVETIKAVIDGYLAPALVGRPADRFEEAAILMDRAAKRNASAKSALQTALFDAVGKTRGLPVHTLLGGAVRARIPVLWALASGDAEQEIDEAKEKIEKRLHNTFKVKIGVNDPAEDIKRLTKIASAIEGHGTLKVVDVNQAWDEAMADRWLPALAEIGVGSVEQPLPHWNLAGMTRLAARHAIPIMADESVFSIHDMFAVARQAAADVVSLKLVKHGCLTALRDVAAIARAAGLGLYGGCLLESSVGTAAHLQVFATLPDLAWGCESFGPLILKGGLTKERLTYQNFCVCIPEGPGLGVTLDEDAVAHFARSD
ncbi:MAG: mandelate racemase [Rhodospirillales bacterium]|nr:mandelate racemase [Rhodospirillales bacterium]